MKALKEIFLFIFVITLSSCSQDIDTPVTTNTELNALEYYQQLDISYGPDSDQKFDLYLPAKRTLNTKVMILIHGGADGQVETNVI